MGFKENDNCLPVWDSMAIRESKCTCNEIPYLQIQATKKKIPGNTFFAFKHCLNTSYFKINCTYKNKQVLSFFIQFLNYMFYFYHR